MGTNRCIKNLLKLICMLQQNSRNQCCLENGCTKPFLGPTINNTCYNTRVITLYNKNGTLITSTYTDSGGIVQTSSFFRIEKILDDCATFLILSENNGVYSSTHQYVTIRLSCVCALKCISDVVVENL